LHDSQTIYHAQSTVVSDTDTVFEDIDNSSHDLPEDVDEDNARYGGNTQSHRAQQLKLAVIYLGQYLRWNGSTCCIAT